MQHAATALLPLSPASPMEAAEGRAVLAKHGRSFWLASLFLAGDQRDDAALLYAFCREVDDLADETPDPAVARRELAAVRDEIAGTRPARPFVAALLDVARRRGLPLQAARHIVDGVEGDLDLVRTPDDRSLMRYCYRVAGAVGLLMNGVIGVRDPDAQAFAVDLGLDHGGHQVVLRLAAAGGDEFVGDPMNGGDGLEHPGQRFRSLQQPRIAPPVGEL